MNIFFLAADPAEAAAYHCDKHIVKMVLESAQLLSTAHRLIAGVLQRVTSPDGKQRQLYLLPGEVPRFELYLDEKLGIRYYRLVIDNALCYNATHANHPCAKWVRHSAANYHWLYQLMLELDKERQCRFTPALGKTIREHGEFLSAPPAGLPDLGFTPPAQAMPDDCKRSGSIEAYRAYYITHKQHLASWTKRAEPSWFYRRIS